MKKTMKKLLPLLLAVVMCLAFAGAALAEGETPAAEPNEFTGGDFSQTAETTIEATGLTAGDTVEVYQLVKWDAATSDWALNGTCGVTLDELVNGITEAEATTIAGNVSTGALTTLTADANGKVSYNCADNPGLFYLKAIPADNNKDTVYNPAFVSADYYAGGNSVDFSTKIGSSTVVKKSTVPFDKTVDSTTDQYVDVKPDDVIPYKITTTIPSYGTSFTNPKFEISDTLSAGLELQETITVKYGDTPTTESNDDVTITPKDDKSGFTVSFSKEYLTGLNGANPAVEITYSAKVTTAGENNVTYMDNKAKLTFSNTPTTTKDKEDITRHYTFAIDGNLLGQTGKEGSELIKTGTDSQGNILTENHKTYHEKEVSILQGAEFKLVGVTGTATAGVEKTATSDANGRINFDGLDAGTYKLTEESAPAGFVKDSREFTVVITPTYSDDPATPDLLVSYTITITADGYDGGATFSMTNDGGVTVTSSEESASNFINNTQGTELPSTGGMGTTIFYIAGSALVLVAGAALFARRVARKQS